MEYFIVYINLCIKEIRYLLDVFFVHRKRVNKYSTRWEIVGNKDFKIGRYSEDYIEWDNERLREWRNYDITSSPICKKCKYALYCGGGCVAHARFGKREHCAYFRQMFNISVNRAFESLIK